jgi:hypothetical protein
VRIERITLLKSGGAVPPTRKYKRRGNIFQKNMDYNV